MKKILLTVALLYSLLEVVGQTTYSNEIKAQIKQVENNLAGRIIIDGKGDNLLDRMKHFKVKGSR